ncbi:hypothetical protein [Spiroplasma endosymbiont of Labia minor]|uniref:hypothetical protein n=1 Tax=Spiroplasma endosymbiont of Labia minor TaxID=3066305 RepID=UPI0030D50510
MAIDKEKFSETIICIECHQEALMCGDIEIWCDNWICEDCDAIWCSRCDDQMYICKSCAEKFKKNDLYICGDCAIEIKIEAQEKLYDIKYKEIDGQIRPSMSFEAQEKWNLIHGQQQFDWGVK